RRAVDALLRELALKPADVDRVVLAGTRIPSYDWMNRVMRDEAYMRRYYGVALETPRRGLAGRARKLGAKLGLLDPAPGKAPLTPGGRRRPGPNPPPPPLPPLALPRPPPLPRGRPLLRTPFRRPRRAGAPQRYLRRRTLRHRVER